MNTAIKGGAITLCLLSTLAGAAFGNDREAAADAAADVLFDLDIENVSFKVRHDGYVDLVFGPGLPESRYRAAIRALKAHPQIPGILAGRGTSDLCPVP
jgi:hypothetical protein